MKRAKRASFTVLYLAVAVGALGAVKKTRSPEVAVVHALAASREQSAAIDDWMPGYVDRVREAFEEWQAVVIPLGFVFVDDSADAEVHVNWIDHFSEPISGRTKWARDDEWLITDANIILAVHHHQGE